MTQLSVLFNQSSGNGTTSGNSGAKPVGFPVLGLNSAAFLFRRCPAQWCCEQEQCKACPMAVLESPWMQAQHSWCCVLPSWRCGTCLETPLEAALRWLKCNPGQNLPLSSLEIHGMGYGSTQNRVWGVFLLLGWVLLPQKFISDPVRVWLHPLCLLCVSHKCFYIYLSASLEKSLKKLCALPHDKLVLAVISFSVKLWISILKSILNTGLLFCLLSNAGDFPQPWAGLLFALQLS